MDVTANQRDNELRSEGVKELRREGVSELTN